MQNALFSGRLVLLRTGLTEGPVATLTKLREKAGVSFDVLMPNYSSVIGEELRERIAFAAAVVLERDPDELHRWLVEGADAPELEDYLRWLPTQVRCTGCKGLFDADSDQYEDRISRCKPCIREQKRKRKNPRAGRYEILLQGQLPQIRAVAPRVAKAVEETIAARESVTYARLSKRALISIIEITRLLKSLGLDKRAVALAIMLSSGVLYATPVRKCVLPQPRRWRWSIFAPFPTANDNGCGFSPLAEVA